MKFLLLKYLLLLLAFAFLFNERAFAGSDDHPGIFVQREEKNDAIITYYLDETNLLPVIPWRPESEALPVNIAQLVTRAESHLRDTKEITNKQAKLAIIEFAFQPFSLVKKDAARLEHGGAEFTNCWYLDIQFVICETDHLDEDVRPDNIIHRVLIFLNGTVATTRTNFPKVARVRAKSLSDEVTNPPPNQKSDPLLNVGKFFADATSELLNPQLPLSAVTWNPFGADFPMDIPVQIKRAREFLLAKGVSADGLEFEFIVLDPFGGDVLQVHGLKPDEGWEHWTVKFYFWDKKPLHEHTVCMLLDGRIITPEKDKR